MSCTTGRVQFVIRYKGMCVYILRAHQTVHLERAHVVFVVYLSIPFARGRTMWAAPQAEAQAEEAKELEGDAPKDSRPKVKEGLAVA